MFITSVLAKIIVDYYNSIQVSNLCSKNVAAIVMHCWVTDNTDVLFFQKKLRIVFSLWTWTF